MDATTAAVLAGFAGLLTGALAVVAVRYSERQQTQVPETAPVTPLPPGVADVLSIDPQVGSTRYPERVEAAAYFCCLEALAGESAPSRVTVSRDGDDVVLALVGTSIAPLDRHGIGDRVEAAGGELVETGDRLTIRLPGAPAPAERPATPARGAPG